MTEQTRRIVAQVDRVHEMLADGFSDRQIAEHLILAHGLTLFEAEHAIAQAAAENGD
jgi:hypothetical protein